MDTEPMYQTIPPQYDFFNRTYVFWIYTDAETRLFIRKLPSVRKVYYDALEGVALVVLEPLHAMDKEIAQRSYTAILRSVDAHLDPPLAECWIEAIQRAFDEELPF